MAIGFLVPARFGVVHGVPLFAFGSKLTLPTRIDRLEVVFRQATEVC